MKNILLLLAFIPVFAIAGSNPPFGIQSTNLMQVRVGDWPITLERHVIANDTSYVINFRDQHMPDAVAVNSLEFCSLADLKYFAKGLMSLKSGGTGDIAEFSTYSIKRFDVKKDGGAWYTLSYGRGVTNFRQFEANVLVRIISTL